MCDEEYLGITVVKTYWGSRSIWAALEQSHESNMPLCLTKPSLNSSRGKILIDTMKSPSSSASIAIKLMNTQKNASFKPRKIIAIVSVTLLFLLSSVVFLDKSDVHALPILSGHSGGGVPSGVPANVGGFNRGPVQSQSVGPLSGVQPNGVG